MKKYLLLILTVTFCSALYSERHIAIFIDPNWLGEAAFAYRLKIACQNIMWEADIITIQDNEQAEKTNYSFTINLVPYKCKYSYCKNYIAIFHPKHHYFNKDGRLKKKYQDYDGYLLTYSPGAFDNDKKDFVDKVKFPYMLWFPTAQEQDFQVVDPSYLFHICCVWGDRFHNKKFQECLSLLDKQPYTRFYGNQLLNSLHPKSYQGSIPLNSDKLFEVASQAGVSLVLHSSDHNKYGVPSGRIFEAAAASTVIICDQNSFVKESFGDSILYIDTNNNGKSIFNQIQNHMEWINMNKIEALEKAKKAHEIYKKYFLLENQLIELGEFHDRLSQE